MDFLSTSDAWIGRSIGEYERYLIQHRLGGGSMGDVFIAMDTRLGQEVAIKILKSNWAATEELSRRFEHEVALCAALKGDHVVQVSDYGITPEGYPFFVMEYLKGQTLGQLLRQERRLSPKQAINIIVQVCKGLELAHSGVTLKREGELIKVVHRDLKPENIFLTETSLGELVKILDFGIAKIQHAQRENTHLTSMFMGTFRYASPEQVEVRQDLDGRSDIYSLGVILYEMLSGTNPFGLEPNSPDISQMSWAIAHASKLPIPLRSQFGCEPLSLELEAIVMRCLQKQPHDRFASVIELRHALQAVVEATRSAIGIEDGSVGSAQVVFPHSPALPVQETSPIQATFPPIAPVAEPSGKTRFSEPILPPEREKPIRRNIPLMPILAGFLVAVLASVGLYFWSDSSPPPSPPSPVPISPVPTNSPIEISTETQLKQANELAASGKLADAIAAASQIPANSPVYANAQQQIENWSQQILLTADKNFRTTDSENALEQAIAQAGGIPASSPVFAQAQAKIKQWQTEWQTAKDQIKTAKTAAAAAQWDTVLEATQNLPQIRFWQEQAKPLVQTAKQEIQRRIPKSPIPAPEPKSTYEPPAPEPIPTYEPPAPEPTYEPPPPAPTYEPPAPEPTPEQPPILRPSGPL